MLTRIDAFLALRRAVGFQLETEEYLLHDFARWAAACGETHVQTQTAMEWAAATRSPWQRERRLRTVAIFARHARAEDTRHEVPPTCVFGHKHIRPAPHIYSPEELRLLLEAASRLTPTWPLRPQVFGTTVPASLFQRERVACDTPTSVDSAVADFARGPVSFSTIRFRKLAEYCVTGSSCPLSIGWV